MSNSRDPSVDRRSRAGARTGSPVRDPTESLAPDHGEDDDIFERDDDDMDPLSSSQAPLGTRDKPSRALTRVESPAARNRTPHPPEPAPVEPLGVDGPPPRQNRGSRPSRPPPRPAAEHPEERIGQVLGSYRLHVLIGKGGMGFVYRAEHIKLGRTVALKLLRSDYAKRRDSVARFFQEARTVNRVRHRNIVDVTDFVELDDGTTFIIMELLEGESFGRWAKRAFSVPRALALLVQICDGLAAAHAVGVIHRDLKPDNVVVVPTGDGAELVKLLDFGVAKLLNRDDEDIGLETQAGSVIGTPAYMSPEQAGGTTVDFRSDIYSLGAIMYELFTGQPMFKGRSFGEFVRKHLNELPIPPRQTPGGAGLDDRIEAVILRCIEKDPMRRYPTLGMLRDDLLHLLGSIETQVGAVRDLGGTDSLRSSDLMPASSRRSQQLPSAGPPVAQLPAAAVVSPRPARWPWAVAGLVVTGATVAAIAIATSGTGPANPSRAPAPPTPGVEPQPVAQQPEVIPLGPLGSPPEVRRGGAPTVDVRFSSTPLADVFEVGSASPRCHTPCLVQIDPTDGGSTHHRDYVVRADGFVDQTVTVDLTAPPAPIEVALERRDDATSKRPAKEPKPKVDDPKPRVDDPEPKVDDPKPKVDDPKPRVDDPEPKVDKPPKDPKKPIDSSVTKDPFAP